MNSKHEMVQFCNNFANFSNISLMATHHKLYSHWCDFFCPLVLRMTSYTGVLLCIADEFAAARANMGLGLRVEECRLDK